MSEPIGMSIEIGGTLPANLIDEFFSAIQDDISDIFQGPTSEEDLKTEAGKGSITWMGTANYGLCNDLFAFCENHKLSYLHHSDASGQYDATIAYWLPGMKEAVSLESSQEGSVRVAAEDVRPLFDLLLSLVENKDSLAKFIGVEGLEDIVEKGMKKPSSLLSLLEKRIEKLLPVPPSIPSFIIKE